MHSDREDIARGLRMAAVAVVSAVVTATVVIGAGQAWLSHNTDNASQMSGGRLIRTGS